MAFGLRISRPSSRWFALEEGLLTPLLLAGAIQLDGTSHGGLSPQSLPGGSEPTDQRQPQHGRGVLIFLIEAVTLFILHPQLATQCRPGI